MKGSTTASQYTAVSLLDLCKAQKCPFYSQCDNRKGAKCQCPDERTCSQIADAVCGSDGETYLNDCVMKARSCRKGVFVEKAKDGACGKISNSHAHVTYINLHFIAWYTYHIKRSIAYTIHRTIRHYTQTPGHRVQLNIDVTYQKISYHTIPYQPYHRYPTIFSLVDATFCACRCMYICQELQKPRQVRGEHRQDCQMCVSSKRKLSCPCKADLWLGRQDLRKRVCYES